MQFDKTSCLPVCLFLLFGQACPLRLNEDKKPRQIPLVWREEVQVWEFASGEFDSKDFIAGEVEQPFYESHFLNDAKIHFDEDEET